VKQVFFFLISGFLYLNSISAQNSNQSVQEKIDWREQIIYMALTDRFFNGNPENDTLGASGCFDPSNPFMYHGGDIEGFIQKVNYLKELGITALWTSPLYEQVPKHAINAGRDDERDDTPSCGYHGYVINFRNPDDQAVEPKFGTPEDVKKLINELKSNDILMIFDMLVNQAGWNADIVETNPNWFNKLEDHGNDNSCAYLDVTHMCIYGLPDFKIDDPVVGEEVRKYLNEMSKAWVRDYDIAGIRFDAPMLVPSTYFPEWFEEVRSVKNDLFIFAETYDYRRPKNYKDYLNAGFNGTLNFYLQGALKETFAKGNSTNIIADHMNYTIEDLGLEQTQLMVNFIDNHDVERFMSYENKLTSNDVRRHHLGLIALLTLPGIPQIYYGNEIGAYGSYPDNRRDMPAWVWNERNSKNKKEGYLPQPDNTFELTKQLIMLRKSNEVFTKGNYIEVYRQGEISENNVYGFLRSYNNKFALVVINNGSYKTGEFLIDLSENLPASVIKNIGSKIKSSIEFNSSDIILKQNGKVELNLDPKSACIYLF
jgi:alpha-amylase